MAKRRRKWSVRNLGLTVTLYALLVLFEGFSAGAIMASGHVADIMGVKLPLGPIEAAITLMCACLSLVVNLHASAMAADPRPEQKQRAIWARVLSIGLLIIPMGYLANGFAMPRQIAAYEAYRVSDQRQADLAAVEDVTLDSRAQREAADRLGLATRPTEPKPTFGEIVKAIVLHIGVWFAAMIAPLARPETRAGEKARLKAETKAKSDATRATNKAKEEERIAAEQRALRAAAAKGTSVFQLGRAKTG